MTPSSGTRAVPVGAAAVSAGASSGVVVAMGAAARMAGVGRMVAVAVGAVAGWVVVAVGVGLG